MDQLPVEKLTQTRLSEQMAGQIETLILGNHLRPGDKLPSERELAIQFGVSRTAVRESIKLLQERGLLESRNGRGAFVTTPGVGGITSSLNVVYQMQDCTFDHLHEARWCLETFIARLAAERAGAEDIARMEAAVAAMEANLHDPDRYLPADLEFHVALAQSVHNPLFYVMTRPLVALIHSLGAAGFRHGDVAKRFWTHVRLLECIKNRDAAGAEETMRTHLNMSIEAVEMAGLRESKVHG